MRSSRPRAFPFDHRDDLICGRAETIDDAAGQPDLDLCTGRFTQAEMHPQNRIEPISPRFFPDSKVSE
ncbi:MAG: hypothetical protein MOB07_07950 [Acidobacteria bacterium]|nr:hypothetical protein [Acidobacteriota bacterium]